MQTPARFDYERATSLEGAIASLKEHEDSRVIAGGHSLLPMMKLRLANPTRLIDINDLTDLAYIRAEGDEIAIGALTRHVDLLKSELLRDRVPVFHHAELGIPDPVVRNRARLGASLCRPAAAEDLSAVSPALRRTSSSPAPKAQERSAWPSSISARGRPRWATARSSPRS